MSYVDSRTYADRKEYQRQWARANRGKINAYSRLWARRNPDKRRKYEKLCRRGPQEAILAQRQLYLNKPYLRLLTSARARAKQKQLPCDLTQDWAEARWTGKCELTGIAFVANIGRGHHGSLSPSIDRIDIHEGYTQRNCRFVLMAVNALKGTGSDLQMYQIAEALVANRSHGK